MLENLKENRLRKKLNGVYYTPQIIVNYINKKTIIENSKNEIKIIDPACGYGVFLLDALFKLKVKTQKTYKEIVENNIYGIDIDSDAVKICKDLLLAVVYKNEGIVPERINIFCGNSLDKNFLKNIFGELKFDVVIGNPPYIKIQNIKESLKKLLKENYQFFSGNSDLYVPFFELGLYLLNDNGKLGYIIPNSFLISDACVKLREHLIKNRYIEEIIDFGEHQIFEGATIYTSIVIISKINKSQYIHKKIQNKQEIFNLDLIEGERKDYLNIYHNKIVFYYKKDEEKFNVIFNKKIKLKDIADIRIGLQTSANEVFVLENYQDEGGHYTFFINGKKFLVEKEIVKDVVKVNIIKSEEDIVNNKKKIIFPYKKEGEKYVIIEENELKEKFPMTYEYLLFNKEKLLIRDKGKKEYKCWYAYGREQGLNTTFGKKLLVPTMAIKPTFIICEKEDILFYSGYGIFPKKEPFTNLILLKKLLNSDVMNFCIDKVAKVFRGGWKSYARKFIKDFGLPQFTNEDVEYILNETNQEKLNKFLWEKYYKIG